MESKKDKATKAAEWKYIMQDFAGARKEALEAHRLNPKDEGVSKMLAALDVHFAAENKVNEEVNWYGILNASPSDDTATLRRNYKKLALTLHPDKNNFRGAENAFKHVNDAWNFLSDKEKREAYDHKMSLHTINQEVSVSSPNNEFCNFAKTSSTADARTTMNQMNTPHEPASNTQETTPSSSTANARTTTTQKNSQMTQKKKPQKRVAKTKKTGRSDTASGSAQQPSSTTFWTVCMRCMLQYEYPIVYVNRTLLCPSCRRAFSAVEVPGPGKPGNSRLKQYLDLNLDADHSASTKWTFSRTSCEGQASSVVQDYEEARATAGKAKKNAKRKSTMDSSSASGGSRKRRKVRGETEFGGFGGRKVTYSVIDETGRLGRRM